MIRPDTVRRLALRGLATIFVGVTLAYAAVWVYSVRWQPPTDLGLRFAEGSLEIAYVDPGGPADEAGVKPYDRVVDLDGSPVETQLQIHDALRTALPGTPARLTVRIGGLGERPRSFDLTLGPRPEEPRRSWLGSAAHGLARSYPLLLVTLLAAVLFVRPERVEAWLVSAAIAGMIATAPLMGYFHHIPPEARTFAVTFKVVAWAMAPALLYHLLAVFPEPSPLDQRLPWLKQAWPAASMLAALFIFVWLRSTGVAGLPESPAPGRGMVLGWLSWIAALGFGVVSLVSNYRQARTDDDERPTRILLFGLGVTLVPLGLVKVLALLAGKSVGDLALWLRFPAFVALLLLPLAFAYVATSRELLDLFVIGKRCARFALVHPAGAIGLVVVTGGLIGAITADALTGLADSRVAGAVAGAIVFAAIVGGGVTLHRRFVERIEGALFGDVVRTRQTLENLGQRISEAATLEDLAQRLERQIEQALLPSSFALYLTDGETLRIARGFVDEELREIPLEQPLIPLDEENPDGTPKLAPIGSLDRVARLGPDCLVPIGRGSMLGLLVLGARRSDEPYTRDDLALLASAAEQAGPVVKRLLEREAGSVDEAADDHTVVPDGVAGVAVDGEPDVP